MRWLSSWNNNILKQPSRNPRVLKVNLSTTATTRVRTNVRVIPTTTPIVPRGLRNTANSAKNMVALSIPITPLIVVFTMRMVHRGSEVSLIPMEIKRLKRTLLSSLKA
jgi:hypothetical protein